MFQVALGAGGPVVFQFAARDDRPGDASDFLAHLRGFLNRFFNGLRRLIDLSVLSSKLDQRTDQAANRIGIRGVLHPSVGLHSGSLQKIRQLRFGTSDLGDDGADDLWQIDLEARLDQRKVGGHSVFVGHEDRHLNGSIQSIISWAFKAIGGDPSRNVGRQCVLDPLEGIQRTGSVLGQQNDGSMETFLGAA